METRPIGRTGLKVSAVCLGLIDSLRGAELQLDAEELAACDGAWYSLPREHDPQIARR